MSLSRCRNTEIHFSKKGSAGFTTLKVGHGTQNVKNPRSMGRTSSNVNEENIKSAQNCGRDLEGRKHLCVLGEFKIRIWKRSYLATAQEDPVHRRWHSQSTADVLHSSNNLLS